MNRRIGFMQGRLSDQVDGLIQAFPWNEWEEEFPRAASIGVHLMEWTLDQKDLRKNPLLINAGRERIAELCTRFDVRVGSLTGDCFMQAPFWKVRGTERESLLEDFRDVIDACAKMQVHFIVVPLVDNGALRSRAEEDLLVDLLMQEKPRISSAEVKVLFESDYGPQELARFIGRLPTDSFGVNYDIGNSAAMGFSAAEEISAYGKCIANVHVKDRVLGGTTVPLGTGAADFETVFAGLAAVRYSGCFIMQTARATDGNHIGAIRAYRDQIQRWIAS